MMAVLVAVRDALIALALAWVGVTLENRASESAAPTSAPPACSAGGLCTAVADKPGFNALDCDDR